MDSGEGASAMAFEAELPFQGVEDGFELASGESLSPRMICPQWIRRWSRSSIA
jgi:hypothetical protein